MKKLVNSILVVFLNIIALNSCSESSANIEEDDYKHGLWEIKSEQYLQIIKNDTTVNTIQEDGRIFQLNEKSELVVYWQYPNSSDISLWKEVGLDSLHMYFDGPNSDIIYKYKYQKVDNSKMIWEQNSNAPEGYIQKSIFEVVKK